MEKKRETLLHKLFGSGVPADKGFDAFISYRRETGSDLASLIKIQLENRYHKRIFLDVKELQVGRFDEMLLTRIEETPNFILILSKDSLDRCVIKTDWLKREIMQAIKTGRNIIPVLAPGFSLPSEELWKNLPAEMQVLQSLNGITYNHIYQDTAIEKILSYMIAEVPTLPPVTVPLPDKPVPPPSPGTLPSDQKPVPPPQPVPHDPRQTTYFPVTGVLVADASGTKTVLTEFCVRADSYSTLDSANRDDLTVGMGQGTRAIRWGMIESVEIKNQEDASVRMCDGTSLDHVRLIPLRLVGKNDNDFFFVFEFKNPLTITTLRDSTLPTRDELIRNIPLIASRANPQASKSIMKLEPDGRGVLVTVDDFYYSELKYTHTFRMPGPYSFLANGRFVSFKISLINGENFTLGPFPVETALALTLAMDRLNSLLSDEDNT